MTKYKYTYPTPIYQNIVNLLVIICSIKKKTDSIKSKNQAIVYFSNPNYL